MKSICSFIFLLCITLNVSAQQIQRKLDSLFDGLDKSHSFSGNVLVAEKGKIIYKRSTGYADLDNKILNSDESRFQIGSVSKTFTSVAIFQLYERGKLDINNPLVRYLPGFPYPTVTLYQLLSHTSGIPDKEELFMPIIENEPDRQFTNADIIPALKNLHKELAFTPGSKWRYCNIGYCLLSMVVEKVSGRTFSEYLTSSIFKPANMTHSSLLSTAKQVNQVNGYTVRAHYLGDLENIEESKKTRPWTYNMRGLVGPTNIVSNACDLFNYDQALSNGKLLKAASVAKMLTPAKLSDGSLAKTDGEFGMATYAMGWFVQTDTIDGKIAMHTGREPGFFSYFVRDLTHNRTIILIDNAESQDFGTACKETFNILSGRTVYPKVVFRKSLFLPYVKILQAEGPDKAIAFFNFHKDDTDTYFTDERELNELGLELLTDKQLTSALEALKLCTLLYPKSWNTYDSYGGALLAAGMKEQAIAMYRKSVMMFPGNLPGKKILDELTK